MERNVTLRFDGSALPLFENWSYVADSLSPSVGFAGEELDTLEIYDVRADAWRT